LSCIYGGIYLVEKGLSCYLELVRKFLHIVSVSYWFMVILV
jgi:hypothetical protein